MACSLALEIASCRIIGRSRVQRCRPAAEGGHRRPTQDRGGTVPLTEEEEKQDLVYAASLHQKARQKELDAVASRLANMEDSISHMDFKTPVLDVGSY